MNQREESDTKMSLMKDKEEKDKLQLNTELKELIRVIDHDKKLKEFMKVKTQERNEDEELIIWRKRKGKLKKIRVLPFKKKDLLRKIKNFEIFY